MLRDRASGWWFQQCSPSWWRHQMKTFSALLAICAGNSPVTGEFPAQRPVTRSFDVFSDLPLNERLSKQSWGWWFETPSWSLWRHCNAILTFAKVLIVLLVCNVCVFTSCFTYCPACRTTLICLCLLISFFNFIMNYVPIVTFWIFTYHKIWILSIMFCFIWSYWIIYFLACLEVSWRVVS